MFVLIILITMTRGAIVQVEVPFPDRASCEAAASSYRATGMSAVVISTTHRCEERKR